MPQGIGGVRLGAALLILTWSGTAIAQRATSRDQPPSETGLVNRTVPDITLTTSHGDRLTLSEAAHGRPVLLTFVFTRCAGICSPFLRSWRTADRALGSPPSYTRIVLSFDPRDTVEDVAMLTHHLELPEEDRNWIVAVADPADVRRLADAVGFWWAWDSDRQQFDHPAMLAGIRDGRLGRLLAGGSVSTARLNELMREISGEFVRSYPLPGRVLFRCLQYDPATGRLTLDWGFAVLLLPVVVTTVTTSLLFAAGVRMRRRGQNSG